METQLDYDQEKMFELLQEKKNFRITNKLLGQGRNSSVIGIYDKSREQEFALKIINISDGLDGINKMKLTNAQKQVEILQNNNDHPNILQYIDSFQIGTNYFIQMEKCHLSLQNLLDIGDLSYSREIFLNLKRQILNAISFLHYRNLVLKNISLKNILIFLNNQKNNDDDDDDRDNEYQFGYIKICNFGYPDEINIEMESYKFYSNLSNNFYPPEIINIIQQNKLNKKNKIEFIKQNFKCDIWCLGIILYLLLGYSHINAFQLATGKEIFKPIKSSNYDLHVFIQNILISNPDERPNIQQINLSFSNISYQNNQRNIIDKSDQHYFNEGMIFKDQFEYDKSIEQLQLCLKANPNHEYANFELGQLYYFKESYNKTIKYLTKQLLINPLHEEINNYFGIGYSSKKMCEISLQYYLRQLQMNPKQINIHMNIGHHYYNKKMYNICMIYYLREFEMNPNHGEIIGRIGDIYYNNKQYNECIIYYMKQIQINDNIQNIYFNLGFALFNIEKYDESIIYLKKQIQINPKHDLVNIFLGHAYFKKDLFHDSIQYYLKQLDINPSYNEIHNSILLAQIMLKKEINQ